MRRSIRQRWRLPALSTGLVLVLSVVIAYAAMPSSTTGVISGCYGKSNGQLRVIDAEGGETCKNNELAVSWNREGRQGR